MRKREKSHLPDSVECIHHWEIDPPNGPMSRGVCLICGAEREFSNYVPFSLLQNKEQYRMERERLLTAL